MHYDKIYIEQHENYLKRSYRNRCHIAGANGLLRLSIPLRKGKNERQNIRQTKISYDENWQAHHWQSIKSAYSNAPFFDYYADELAPYFEQQQQEYLFDWNWGLLQEVIALMGIAPNLELTETYQTSLPDTILNFRNGVSPKTQEKSDPNFEPQSYSQVFLEKSGFLPNLSILDLLFCTGPEASYILEKSVKIVD